MNDMVSYSIVYEWMNEEKNEIIDGQDTHTSTRSTLIPQGSVASSSELCEKKKINHAWDVPMYIYTYNVHTQIQHKHVKTYGIGLQFCASLEARPCSKIEV